MPRTKSENKKLELLGNRVRELRLQKNMTQQALALAIDKDKQSIQRLEAGGVNPSYLYLLQICEGLETTPAIVFDF